jgi:hypothetical protein
LIGPRIREQYQAAVSALDVQVTEQQLARLGSASA